MKIHCISGCFLLACAGAPKSDDTASADTDTTSTETETETDTETTDTETTDTETPDSATLPTDSGSGGCPDGVFTGPTVVEEASVACTGSIVRFYARTEGWTSDGYVFSQETANEGPQYSDEHDLESYQWDSCGAWDELEQEITDNAVLSSAVRNQSTVFRCDAHYEAGLLGPPVMTYAFGVNDTSGILTDCLAFGDDVAGMKSGAYPRLNEPSFDLSICSEGVAAR